MSRKKIITLSLILVLGLQLLPIRQAVEYFFVDNGAVEELAHASKNATQNFRFVDEDSNFLYESDQFTPGFFLRHASLLFQYQERLPAILSADIHTPPPNYFF